MPTLLFDMFKEDERASTTFGKPAQSGQQGGR